MRTLLENGYRHIWLDAEVSGHRRYPSGHHYFTLKDEKAQLSAVIWRSVADRLAVHPEEGMAVRVRGTLSIYPARGNYQILVDRLEPVGAGALRERFEKLRRQLESEGLFDLASKKPLPAFPQTIAVVTSAAGAAVKDVIRVTGRRWPLARIVIVPTRVQGAGAATEVADAIALADRRGYDLLIVGRGGGSLEDLWAFNEEPVARAVFAAQTPIVSAVGHEVDITICDLVADVRAATPSAAAELVTPDQTEIRAALSDRRRRMGRALSGETNALRLRLDRIAAARCFRKPFERIQESSRRVDEFAAALSRATGDQLRESRSQVAALSGRLEALSPVKVLARGYSVTWKDGDLVRRADDVTSGDRIRTVLGDGEISSTVD